MTRAKAAFYIALYHLAKSTDSSWAKIFHRLVRRGYLNFGRLLGVYLRLRSRGQLGLLTRHSVQDEDHFNAWMSDLDLTILFSEKQSHTLALAQSWHRKLKKFFIFIGECEFYEVSEWQELGRLIERNLPLHKKIRAWRKCGWLLDAPDSRLTPYHLLKTKRALKKSWAVLGIADLTEAEKMHRPDLEVLSRVVVPEEKIARLLPVWERLLVGSPTRYEFFHFYLGQRILCDLSDLSQIRTWIALAYLPYDLSMGELESVLNKIRAMDPEINQVYQDLTRIELLTMYAVAPTYSQPPAWATYAIECLETA